MLPLIFLTITKKIYTLSIPKYVCIKQYILFILCSFSIAEKEESTNIKNNYYVYFNINFDFFITLYQCLHA